MFPSWPSTGSTACAVKLSVPGVANWAGVASAPFVTPKYIKEFLNVSSAAAAASHPNASQSCAEFGPEGVSESDLETFLHRMNITGSGLSARRSCVSVILSFCHSVILSFCHSVILSVYVCVYGAAFTTHPPPPGCILY